jgi:hypothetical protein
MQLIRCTAKLIKELGLKKSALVDEPPKFSFLGQWHANLIYIYRRKCVLFANDKTLINFIVPDVSRAEIKNLGNMFESMFRCILADEGYSQEQIKEILTEYSEIGIGKSNNRSVLGSLNDLAFHYEHSILENGGPHSAAIPSIISRLNRMPMHASKKGIFPIKELQKLYPPAS